MPHGSHPQHSRHHHHPHNQDQDSGGGESDIGFEEPTYGEGDQGGDVDLEGMSVGMLDPYGAAHVGFGDEDDFDPIADQATPEEILGPNFQPAVLEPGAWAPEETAPTLRNLKFEFAGEYYSGFGPAAIIGCEREGTGALKK